MTITLSSSAELRSPPRWSGNFRLSARFLEHHPVTLPPTNFRRKPHNLQLSPQILPVNTSPHKPSGSSGFLSTSLPFSLLGPAINLSLLQTRCFGLFGLSVCQVQELCLVTWSAMKNEYVKWLTWCLARTKSSKLVSDYRYYSPSQTFIELWAMSWEKTHLQRRLISRNISFC